MGRQDSMNLFNDDKPFVKGRLIITVFHNDSNLYSVVRIRVSETNTEYDEREAVVTGHFPQMHEEDTYTFFGQFKDHPKFGKQFVTEHFQKEIPQTKHGVALYLSGEIFKGIGKKTAERIVETLGENAITKILEEPSVLEKVPKFPPEKAKELYNTLMEHQGLENVMMGLNQYGFGPQLSMKIYQVYRQDTLSIIQKNPYKLVEDIDGIGFKRADELGEILGISGNHPDRIKAACLYTMDQRCLQEGHVYLENEDVLQSVKELLESSGPRIEFTLISEQIIHLEEESKLVVEQTRLYLPSLYYSETGIATHIRRLLSNRKVEATFPESEFLLALGKLEERLEVEYAPSQKEAIQNALSSPILLLTGGPGTGKTTVIKGIVELYAELHGCSLDLAEYKKDEPFPIQLAAPTGRAAKRMAESTGLPSMTIHRLLGWNVKDGFDEDSEAQIKAKLIIIDEMSMVDTWLGHQLFKALPDDVQVVLVGDEDQLPSVGPGNVLKDLLQSSAIPTVRLTHIYRQEEGSSIIQLAHDIKNGLNPISIRQQQKDRSFLPCHTAQIGEVVEKVVVNAIGKGFTAKDIQVLAPMYRGPAGIDKLNVILQEIFNPNPDKKRKEITFGDTHYRVGDKVLQLVNQPENNVFNGDIGEIVSLFLAKENAEKQDMVVVSFEGNEVTYTKQDLSQITLAYCCSIHKSQGSEFPIVILPVLKSYYRMLRKNLLYTAITRSKQFLILCGEEEAFRIGIEREDDQKRQTTLFDRLKQVTGEEVALPNDYLSEIMHTDPMIGMGHVSPYDFLE
jgi:exodeoxyribonuclease V alpha subunit